MAGGGSPKNPKGSGGGRNVRVLFIMGGVLSGWAGGGGRGATKTTTNNPMNKKLINKKTWELFAICGNLPKLPFNSGAVGFPGGGGTEPPPQLSGYSLGTDSSLGELPTVVLFLFLFGSGGVKKIP